MELFKEIAVFVLIGLFFLRACLNSYLFHRINETEHLLFFLLPWEQGSVLHGFNSMFTFHWTIGSEINNGVKQGKHISNLMSLGCGLLFALIIILRLVEQLALL